MLCFVEKWAITSENNRYFSVHRTFSSSAWSLSLFVPRLGNPILCKDWSVCATYGDYGASKSRELSTISCSRRDKFCPFTLVLCECVIILLRSLTTIGTFPPWSFKLEVPMSTLLKCAFEYQVSYCRNVNILFLQDIIRDNVLSYSTGHIIIIIIRGN